MAVTPATIAVELGRTAPDSGSVSEAQWSMWIDDASRAITRRAERLSIDPTTLNAEDVDYVIRKAVVAHVRRPDDATQVTISVDDSSTSKTYSSGTGEVSIRDEWWDILGLSIAEDGDAGSTQMYGEPDTSTTVSWA